MKVNEIFYSLQGEGYWTGTAAVFVRYSGCNMACDFCDTQHVDGIEMTEEEIISEIIKYPASHIIFTGGEPTLQLTRALVDRLHSCGKYIHIETNGSIRLADGLETAIDWITVSPKQLPVKIQRVDELKVVYLGKGQDLSIYDSITIRRSDCHFLQPCDTGNREENHLILTSAINYIKLHPHWRLSLQTHKIIGIR